QARKQKLARLAHLRSQIAETTNDIRSIQHEAQSNQDLSEKQNNHHETLKQQPEYTFDATSPLSRELQIVPWPQGFRPMMLPTYDG
ncbi:hypothetical protein, partial [Pantoea sp. GbtcB22]|uniref:hypothetical protein n=1 Tax=Pantoea sp. GbtcB22 TaxID=2824767 RepID=UPI001C3014C5